MLSHNINNKHNNKNKKQHEFQKKRIHKTDNLHTIKQLHQTTCGKNSNHNNTILRRFQLLRSIRKIHNKRKLLQNQKRNKTNTLPQNNR